MRARAALTCLAVTTLAVAGAAPAGAARPPAPPSCGQTLTVDTRLRADLTCADVGLRLAPGVTLDLGGHTLRGDDSGAGLVVASAGTVRVRNGTVAGWGNAVLTSSVPDEETGPLLVDRVRFVDNTTALLVTGESGTGLYGKDTTVTRSTFQDNAWALIAQWHVEVDVHRTTFRSNTVAVDVSDSQVDVSDSRLVGNGAAMVLGQSGTRVERTAFVDNTSGINVYPTSGATIAHSTFTGSEVAIVGIGNPTVIHVEENRFTDNGTAVLFDLSDGSVTGNVFRRNGTGLLVQRAPWDTTLVQDNTFVGGGDGIFVAEGDVTLQVGSNHARHNSGWGIHAPGVTDLGGNTARGNGNEPQCLGVVCRAS